MFYGLSTPENISWFQATLQRMQAVFGRIHAADQLITFSKNLGFSRDEEFCAAFDRQASNVQERSLLWRLHTLCWAARQVLPLPGDFVECGVYRGFSFAVIADYLRFQTLEKRLYLYDTFKGIPEAYNSEGFRDTLYEAEGDIYPQVRDRFAAYPNVQVVQGIVPESFEQVLPERIALLHIDMNSSVAELAALERLFCRVSPGGMIILDDYGWLVHQAQQRVHDEFFARHGYYVLELPTGQGLVVKR